MYETISNLSGSAAAANGLPVFGETDINSFFHLRDVFLAPEGLIIDANLRDDGTDRDFFEIQSLTPGTLFRAETTDSDLDTVLAMFDGNGEFIRGDDDSGEGLLCSLTGIVGEDGVLNLAVSGFPDFDFNGTADGSDFPHGQSGDYQLVVTPIALPQVQETDINSFFLLRDQFTADDGLIIDANLRADGVDRDYFEITGLTPGAYFEAEIFDSGLDTVLGALDQHGNIIDIDDDSGSGLLCKIDGVVPESGVLNFAVSGYPDFDFDGSSDFEGVAHGESGDYNLAIQTFSDDIPASTSTQEVLEVGQSQTNTVDFPYDEDWFATDLDADSVYVFELKGDVTSQDPIYDPFFRLYDADGNLVAQNDDFGDGLNCQLVYTPETDGTYFASAGGYGNNTGDYALSLEEFSPQPGPVLIQDVPAYDWYHGCAPTAAGMIIGFWDQQGFPDLFDVNTFEASLLTPNVQDHISSPNHNAKYDPTPDDPDLPIPEPTGIADFMGTSVDPLEYGFTYISNLVDGFEGYANLRGYDVNSSTLTNYEDNTPAGSQWMTYVNEIDAGRPVQLTVDIDGDGSIEHCVTGIGYEDRGADGQWYAMYTTWSESETPIWERFQPTSVYEPWSVGYVTPVRFDPNQNTMSDIADNLADDGMVPISGQLPDSMSDPLEFIAAALMSDDIMDQTDAKIFSQAKMIDFTGLGDDPKTNGDLEEFGFSAWA